MIEIAMKRLFCRLFGHDMYTEVYAERRTAYRKRQPIEFYRVIERTYCERCGFEEVKIVSGWMRRTELLQRGWFIEKNSEKVTQNLCDRLFENR